MDLPPLPPDVQFVLLPKTDEAFRFTFEVKRSAMGPYIEEKWGWNEEYQHETHRRHFNAKPFFQIVYQRENVGTVSFDRCDSYFRFGEFYLFPPFQRKGLGTRILRHCVNVADSYGLPVRLEHLKWNPVGSLYKRNGFSTVGESEIHFFMERPFHNR